MHDSSLMLSTKEAAVLSGYSSAYLGHLICAGEVMGEQVGRAWQIEHASLEAYLTAQLKWREDLICGLARVRSREFRAICRGHAEQQELSVACLPPSFLSQAAAFVVALLVVGAGGLAATARALPTAAAFAAGELRESSVGFGELAAAMGNDLSARISASASVAGLAYDHASASVHRATDASLPRIALAAFRPLTFRASSLTPVAQAAFAGAAAPQGGSASVSGIARGLWGVVTFATHASISAEVSLAYGVARDAPRFAYSAAHVVAAVGEGTTRSIAILAAGDRHTSLALVGAAQDAEYAGAQRYESAIQGAATVYLALLSRAGAQSYEGASLLVEVGRAAAGKVRTISGRTIASVRVGLDEERALGKPLTASLAGALAQDPSGGAVEQAPAPVASLAAAAVPAAQTQTAPAAAISPDYPIAVAVPVRGGALAYGDLVDYDAKSGSYQPSQIANDENVFGVAAEHPPVVLVADPTDVPVMRGGRALVNVTLENGPIAPGDGIVASSIPGKGMRASPGAGHIIGYAHEAFPGGQGSVELTEPSGTQIAAGTIVVDLATADLAGGGGTSGSAGGYLPPVAGGNCSSNLILCSLAAKLNATPFLAFLRYLVAVVVAIASLYLAFRSFMTDAENGVISVGRNPRAKSSIQAMVLFNGILAFGIALAGLASGLAILFIQL